MSNNRQHMKTKVVIRAFRSGGDVIALFPEIPADTSPMHCLSYQTIGQHGAASVDLSHCTRPATEDESAAMLEELRRMDYDPQLVKRVTVQMHRERIEELQRMNYDSRPVTI